MSVQRPVLSREEYAEQALREPDQADRDRVRELLAEGEQEIEVGDHVYIGKPALTKVHWTVIWVSHSANRRRLCLQSGMSGRRLYRFPHELTLHSKGVA